MKKREKLKKVLFIISVVFNLLFVFILVLGGILSKNQKSSVKVSADSTLISLQDTRWVLNNELDLSTIGPASGRKIYDINYYYADSYRYRTKFIFEGRSGISSNQETFYWGSFNPSSATKISIVGGESCEDIDLINWFVSNGTLVDKVKNDIIDIELNDLTGTRWQLYNNPNLIFLPNQGRVVNYDIDYYQYDSFDRYNQFKIDDFVGLSNNEESFYWNGSYTSASARNITILGGLSATDSILIRWLYNNASLVGQLSTSFNFRYDINYNAPYQMSSDSMFVTGPSVGANIKTYNFSQFFISNGELYDTIRVVYINSNGTAYFESPTSTLVRVNNNTILYHYNYMEFYNSKSNVSKMVNFRNSRTYYDSNGGSTNVALDYGSTWVNANYQRLDFYRSLEDSQKTNLNQFNNLDSFSNINPIDPKTHVGLSNVFSLLGSAFGGFTTIFAIELLPGITIGLLFFMPLIVGIILFIIWMVKR